MQTCTTDWNTIPHLKKKGGGSEPLVLYHRMSCTLAEALSLSHKVISSSQFNLSLSCTNMHTFNYSLIISVSFHSVFTLNQSIKNICIISHFHTWMQKVKVLHSKFCCCWNRVGWVRLNIWSLVKKKSPQTQINQLFWFFKVAISKHLLVFPNFLFFEGLNKSVLKLF